jgi:hypothetical protein
MLMAPLDRGNQVSPKTTGSASKETVPASTAAAHARSAIIRAVQSRRREVTCALAADLTVDPTPYRAVPPSFLPVRTCHPWIKSSAHMNLRKKKEQLNSF